MKRKSIYVCFFFITLITFLMTSEIGSEETHVESLPSLATHFKIRHTGDLDDMTKMHSIRILTTYSMTNCFIFNGELHGYEYELLRAYERYMNRERKRSELPTSLEFLFVSQDQLIPLLNKGYGDIAAAGLTITSRRADKADFTDPYLTDIDEVIVINKNIKGIQSLDDLSGRRIFVSESSSYHGTLKRLNKKLGQRSLKPVIIVSTDEGLETEEILEMVNAGAVGITVSDGHIARIWEHYLPDIRVLDNVIVRKRGGIAWMVRKNNLDLKTSLSEFIRNHRRGTLPGNVYFNRYYNHNKWIRNPLGDNECETLKNYINIFKKYGEIYDIDWMLIMAVAYRESRFKQNEKSSSGAVGIMQIRPATAHDKNIGITTIESADNNIHAGVKYLAFLKNRYFSDPEIKNRDQIRFALAAYNAGPGKIRKAKIMARKMGLDQNRWFKNVEIAALKTIGREPVTYVPNINKYFVVYKLGLKE